MLSAQFRRLRPVGRRPVAAGVCAAVVAASLGLAGGADAATEVEIPPVAAAITAPQWDDHGTAAGGAPAPLTVLKVRPRGAVAWGAVVTAGADPIPSGQIRLSGLPAGVRVSSGAVPEQVKDQQMTLGQCTTAGDAVTCPLTAPVAAGQSVIAGMILHVADTVPVGDHPISMSIEGAGDPAPVTASLAVSGSADNALLVRATQPGLPRVGDDVTRELHVFNLGGGAARSGKDRLRLRNVLPPGLGTRATGSGTGWRCTSEVSSCRWRGAKVAVGAPFPTLGVKYVVSPQAKRGAAVLEGTQPVTWRTRFAGKGFAPDRQAQQVLVMAPQKPKKQAKIPRRKPVLNLSTTVMGEQTLGGLTTYRLLVNNGGWVPAKHARVDIEAPGHARIVKYTSSPGWKCTTAGRCQFRRDVRANEGLAPIEFQLRSTARQPSAAEDPVEAVVRWQHRGKRYHESEVITDPWVGPMQVQAHPVSKVVHSKVDGVKAGLVAQVAGIGTGAFTYRWRQVCPTNQPCAKVTWHSDVAGSVDGDEATATFAPPQVKKSTKLTFRLTVRSGGAKAVRTVRVRVDPLTTTLKPRLKKSQPGHHKVPTAWDPAEFAGTTVRPVSRVQVNGRGHTVARPGGKLVLKLRNKQMAKVPEGEIRKIKWRVNGEPAHLLDSARRLRKGQVMRLQVPKQIPPIVLVEALVRHPQKRFNYSSEVIRVMPQKVRSSQPEPGNTGSAPAGGTFCDLYQQAAGHGLPSVAFDAALMTFGAVSVAGSSCTDPNAQINYTGGGVLINGVGLTAASGAITPDGLTVTSALFNLPTDDAISADLTQLTGAPVTAGGAIFTVPFTGGALSSMSGTAVFGELPYLPLPDGWTMSDATLTLSYTAAAGYGIAVSAGIAGPAGGSAALAGSISTGGELALSVTAANMWQLVAKNGSTSTFSGSGSITRQPGQSVVYDIDLAMTAPNGSFPLYGGVTMKNATLAWSNAGLQATTTLALTMGGSTYNLAATGSITDAQDWSLDVSTDAAINMRYLNVSGFSGTLSMAKDPVTHDGVLSMDITAAALGIQLWDMSNASLTVASPPTVHVGIFCTGTLPPGVTRPPGCADGTLQMVVDLDGTLTIGFESWSQAIPINATLNADIMTGGIDFEAAIDSNPGFGPAELNMTGAEVFYTDEPSLEPALADNVCMTSSSMANEASVIGVVGQFHLPAGWVGDATGVFDTNPAAKSGALAGYCFSATFSDPSSANGQVPDSVGGFSDEVAIIYSSYQTIVNFNGANWTIPANQLTLIGDFQLSSSMTDPIGGLPAIPVQFGWVPGSSYNLSLSYSPASTYLLGNGDPNSTYAQLTSIGGVLAGTYGGTQVQDTWSLGASATVDVHYPGSPAGTASGSQVDSQEVIVNGTISFGWATETMQITAELTATGENTPVNDAFGISGLDLNSFAVGGTFSDMPFNNSFNVSASITTPPPGDTSSFIGSLTTDLGIQPGTPMAFSLTMSEVSPCFAVQIGKPSGNTLAINWLGVIEANFVEFYVAPNGCAAATTIGLQDFSGFAFAFDGALLGTGVNINGKFSISGGKSTSGTLSVVVDSFSVAGIDVGQSTDQNCPHVDYGLSTKPGPTINFSFATGVSSLGNFIDLDFSGGMDIWGAINLDVCGGFEIAAGDNEEILDFNLMGSQSADLLGVFTESMAFEFDADFTLPVCNPASQTCRNGAFTKLKVAAQQGASVLSIFKESMTAEFDYQNGVVNSLYADFSAEIDAWIVDVSADVNFTYCNPQVGSTCNIINNQYVDSTNGQLVISAGGNVHFWLFGWQDIGGDVLQTSIPIDFSTPVHPAPAPMVTNPPAPPIADWPNTTWSYSPQMFVGINWDPAQLAAAAGVPNDAYLANPAGNPAGQTPTAAAPYGVASNDPGGLGVPDVKFDGAAAVALGDNTATGPQASGASVVGSVTLPQTPTYANVLAGLSPRARAMLTAQQKQCAGSIPKTIQIDVPQWQEGHPLDSSSAALVVSEINWRIFLASVVEQHSINSAVAAGLGPQTIATDYVCGYNNWSSFPSLSEFLGTNSLGTQMNLGYPQPHPADNSQFCLTGLTPDSPYAQACATNIGLLNEAWGTGWGAGSTATG